ncbi:hypothetical protein GWI33_007421 [Rhynchophorus ferrugineus]|uniref:Uncharacterized protein n=1 Tax=Rhynchophorus ferrugineus TaxID=354439 RepID=A0A834MF20_RHYFE|nr:hypothetical protein GWI33_007421 [Rhynchophorus ferrugineus]
MIKTSFARWRFSITSQISGFNSARLFLCFFKSKVYVNKSQIIQHLKDNFGHELEETQPHMLQNVMKNASERAESCIANLGHHLAYIIFQS